MSQGWWIRAPRLGNISWEWSGPGHLHPSRRDRPPAWWTGRPVEWRWFSLVITKHKLYIGQRLDQVIQHQHEGWALVVGDTRGRFPLLQRARACVRRWHVSRSRVWVRATSHDLAWGKRKQNHQVSQWVTIWWLTRAVAAEEWLLDQERHIQRQRLLQVIDELHQRGAALHSDTFL